MFKRIAIIGVGLIGSSLALALRKKNLVEEIIGCSRSSVFTAKDLGIVDEAVTDISEAVTEADLVVICTPLSTYSNVAKLISPKLKEGAIVTDVGSAKYLPTNNVLEELSDAQKACFVPGHPIAGTEKSGPEAGIVDLFNNKKTILTPFENTDKEAVQKIKEMWEAVGSQVEELDAIRHDFIYATVSHSIQFLSSCFGAVINDLNSSAKENIKNNLDRNFVKFIRLIGSDPVMWRDVFIANAANLEKALEMFIFNMDMIRSYIVDGKVEELKSTLEDAYKKRFHFHQLSKGEDHTKFRPVNYQGLDEITYSWMDIMPRLISCAIMESIEESEYAYATGAGLHGFTKNIILEDALDIEGIIGSKEVVVKSIDLFLNKISELGGVVNESNEGGVEQFLVKSREVYNQFQMID